MFCSHEETTQRTAIEKTFFETHRELIITLMILSGRKQNIVNSQQIYLSRYV